MTQSQLEPENLEQSELEYSFFLSNIHIPIRNIHIPTSNIHIPIVNIHIPTSLKLSIQYSIFNIPLPPPIQKEPTVQLIILADTHQSIIKQ